MTVPSPGVHRQPGRIRLADDTSCELLTKFLDPRSKRMCHVMPDHRDSERTDDASEGSTGGEDPASTDADAEPNAEPGDAAKPTTERTDPEWTAPAETATDPASEAVEAGLEKQKRRLDERELGLDRRSEELDEREQQLDEHSEELERRFEQLQNEEVDLNQRKERLDEREQELDEREQELDEFEEELSGRASELSEHEETLHNYLEGQVEDLEGTIRQTMHSALDSYEPDRGSGRFSPAVTVLVGIAGLALAVAGGGYGGWIAVGASVGLFESTAANLATAAGLIVVGLALNLLSVTTGRSLSTGS